MRFGRMAVAVLIGLILAACSKKNEVDASSNVITGVECSGEGDPACGNNGACVLGYCRIPCTGDDECPQEALCIGSAELSGCQLTWDAFCNMSQPCKTGLTCGADYTCRMPCTASDDCPRADQQCVQDACVGMTEAKDAGAD